LKKITSQYASIYDLLFYFRCLISKGCGILYNYLGISLGQLLKNDVLKGVKILGGVSGISRRVTNVNVMEVPDIIDWVSPGEFLITAAYAIKDNIDILLELIPKLNEKGVAGLGIKVGRYVKELPQNIIDLADELSFPIVQVPFNVSHTDVISIILDLVIEEQMDIQSNMESKYKLEFFNNLLSKDESRQNEAIESAKTFNFKLGLKYTVLIIYFYDYFKRSGIGANKSNFNKNLITNSLCIIDRIARCQKETVLYVDKSDSIIILYGSEPTGKAELIKKKVISFCKNIEMESLKKFKKQKFRIGIGRPYIDLCKLNKSYEQAKVIVEKFNKSNTENILHYDDLGLYTILCFDGIQTELVKFCNDTINSIIEYDKLNNTELIKTLRVYFECNGNMKKMSKEMFMHYNTIVYRIQKIKDVTGVDFENGDSRLKFEIALKALELI
jgi:sugar diacid utilization regulator